MKHPIPQLVLSLLCAGAAGCALAAQPGTAPPATQRTPGTSMAAPLAVVVTAPGALNGFKALAIEVEAGKPLSFKFEGTGACKIRLDGGDGARDVEGKLPFFADYIYGTGSMSSFAAFKDYNASASPLGNCKTTGALPVVKIRVINPAPQGVPAAGSQGPAMSSSNLGLTVKPKP